METVLVVIGILIALVAGYWLLSLAISAFAPLEYTGRAFLAKELRRRGVVAEDVPEQCISDFLEFALRAASFPPGKQRVEVRADYVRQLETIADLFVLWRANPDDPSFRDVGASGNPYRKIFENHGIQ